MQNRSCISFFEPKSVNAISDTWTVETLAGQMGPVFAEVFDWQGLGIE